MLCSLCCVCSRSFSIVFQEIDMTLFRKIELTLMVVAFALAMLAVMQAPAV